MSNNTPRETFNDVLVAARNVCAKYDSMGAGQAAQPIRDLANRFAAAHDRQAGDLAWALTQILGDIPDPRSWLDPNLEEFAENVLLAFGQGRHAEHEVPLVGFKPKAWLIPSIGKVVVEIDNDLTISIATTLKCSTDQAEQYRREAVALYSADQLLSRDHHRA